MRLRALAVLLILSSVFAFAKVKLSNYPLKVYILNVTVAKSSPIAEAGQGQGDVQDASGIHGIEFTFSCPVQFPATHADEFYPGRWTRDQRELEIVYQAVGQTRTRKCVVKTTTKPYVFAHRNGEVISLTQAQWTAEADSQPTHTPAQ